MKRKSNQLRPIEFIRNFTKHAAGSVLVKWGDTWVLCTASVEPTVPSFLKGKGQGWVTAEYAMLPSSTGGGRKDRDIKKLKQDARSTEIQRLIGRSLRAAVDMQKLGERQITIDCDVLQADGGTRCASITGGMVALEDAIRKLLADGTLAEWSSGSNNMDGVTIIPGIDFTQDAVICEARWFKSFDSTAHTVDIPLDYAWTVKLNAARIMELAWERGSRLMTCRKPEGIWSVAKKVLHRNDMGMMMYVLNRGASV